MTSNPEPWTLHEETLAYRTAVRIVLVVAMLAAVACSSVDARFFAYPGPQWYDADGNKLSEDVIATYHGPEHCQQHKPDFLHLGWPLGTSAERLADSARQYVRDPDG
ncbi:MAG: hypothetical protein BRC31_03865 [Actinobacteria bacterium QS_5_72_10]|nr:MAG: hypothetical protein BRC31_03865 [Actinobacteria bacterium QS_5_72_10]